jgi:hypothetical protein
MVGQMVPGMARQCAADVDHLPARLHAAGRGKCPPVAPRSATTPANAAAKGRLGARGRPSLHALPVLLAVAGLHLLLLVLLQRAMHAPATRTAPPQAPLVLVWLKPPTPTPPESTSPREPSVSRPTRHPPRPTIAAEPSAQSAATPASASATTAQRAASSAAAAASVPDGDLLDTEASRRAIREAARQRSTGEMGAQATGEKGPVSDPDRLGQEIARGAHGDCLKGEYAGSGMGLFSLPFWLIAELREKCRR